MKVKITIKPEDLKEVMETLDGREDYSTITKVIEIEQSKKNVEFLVKSQKVINWDFTEEEGDRESEESGSIELLPTPTVPKQQDEEQFPIFQEPKTGIIETKHYEIPTIPRAKRKTVESPEDLKGFLMNAYPEGITEEDLYCLLVAIESSPKDLELTVDNFTKVIIPRLATVCIDEEDDVTASILDYLCVMLGYQSPEEKMEFVVNSITKSWPKRSTIKEGVRYYFEYTFATKLAGI